MKHIMVVDDEFDLASTVRAILQGEGFHVETCTDGKEALNLLQTPGVTKPDLVLMDVMIPRVSGLEVLRAMRVEPSLSGIPVILMSVVVPTVDRSEYRWQAFLRKPFTLRALVKTVHQNMRDKADVAD